MIRAQKLIIATMAILVTTASHAQEDNHWSQKLSIDGSLTSRSVMAQGVAAWSGRDNFSTGVLAKLAIHGTVNDMLDTHLRFTTGATDVRGATWWGAKLGSASQKFPFNLDRAYFEFRPTESISIDLGKSPNRFWSPGWTELAFAFPWSQDGLNLVYRGELGDIAHFLTLSHTTVIEYNALNKLDDITMTGAQLGAQIDLSKIRFTPALAIYTYDNIKGTSAHTFGYADDQNNPSDITDISGNSVVTIGGESFFAHDYQLAEAGFEIEYGPANLFYNYIQNMAVDNENTSYTVGFQTGSTQKPGDWSFSYNYRDVQVDAVFAPTHDSWFLDGGSGSVGHQTTFRYQLMPGTTFSIQAQNGSKLGQSGDHYIMDIHADF